MNTSSTLAAGSRSFDTKDSLPQLPEHFHGTRFFAEELTVFLFSCFGYVSAFFVLFSCLTSIVTIATNGEVMIGRMAGGSSSALLALPIVQFLSGLTIRLKVPAERWYGLAFRWSIWTGATAFLACFGFLSLQNFALLGCLNASAIALGYSISGFLPVSRHRKIKTRTDVQWLKLFLVQGALVLLIGPAIILGWAYGVSYLSDTADRIAWLGKNVPLVTYESSDGPCTLQDYRGKTLVVSVIDKVSRFDRNVVADLVPLHKEYSDRSDFAMVTICDRDCLEHHQEAFEEGGFGWRLLTFDRKTDEGFFKGNSFPFASYYLVDRAGIVQSVTQAGCFDFEGNSANKLSVELEKLLN